MYLVGKIINTHGVKGELKVKNESSFDRFFEGSILYILKDGNYEQITVNSSRTHQNMILITINNLKNINDVLRYGNCDIYIEKHEDELEDGHYYYEDLIDSNVYLVDDSLVGIVKDIMELPNGIVLEIKRENNKDALIPFEDEFIKEVNVKEKKIIITPIEGML